MTDNRNGAKCTVLFHFLFRRTSSKKERSNIKYYS
nr:MAG TPA: hypothetical protein [Caudoviricetes sp.]